ncbi:MAG: dihydropteroate synthase [Clostridia bacterium]|nr:dihydropteroate synthase [Clostridia bacterium]
MIISDKKFENYTYVMAIINLTPDSFFSGSRKDEYTVLKAVERAVKDGAAVIDIGAQSTRPGYTEVSADEEISRFEKPLRLIKDNFEIPVSVDTYFSKSAEAALCLGADMINDVWGLAHDSDMAKIIAKHSASVCIMHNAKEVLSGDIWQPITGFLKAQTELALSSGIAKDKICLDGGIGFAKTKEQNWELLNGYHRLSALGYPLLLGTSRKSMFGGDVNDRLAPTVESTRLAARNKILFVRVHDIKENAQAIKECYEQNN